MEGSVTENKSPTAVQKVDASGRAVSGEYDVRAADGVKVQVIVQWRGEASADHPEGSETRGGRRGSGGGSGGAAWDELCVAVELKVDHLGGDLVVLQLVVVVVG